MSFAIIQTGGKQYKVQTSDIIKVEKLHKDKPGKIEFNDLKIIVVILHEFL